MIKNCPAFTLIELLIVVAIIAILAAIAVPNFLEAQTRAKVSRVKADMRSLATAVESYAVDHNKPPVRNDAWNGGFVDDFANASRKIFDPAFPNAMVGMKMMTTPIGYMTTIPADVFNLPIRQFMAPGTGFSDALDYFDPIQTDHFVQIAAHPAQPVILGEGKGYMLFSVGPDQYFGTLGAGPLSTDEYPISTPTFNTYNQIYDPSNGTVSPGNVFRFEGNLEQGDLLP